MRSAVVIFPGSNCDRDLMTAFETFFGTPPVAVWHQESELPKVDVIGLPGGFSYGDYLRAGSMAARTSIMPEVVAAAKRGVRILAICNGFQIATECGLLPGALMRNAGLRFICDRVRLRVDNVTSAFTCNFRKGQVLNIPIAHHDGNYCASESVLKRLEDKNLVAFRYLDNPNGSAHDIAGIVNPQGNVLGMMPHPERAIDLLHGGVDGSTVFESLMAA